MNIINQKQAFNLLEETLCGKIRADSWSCNIQAFDRLRESIVNENTTTNFEKAVLLRQALVCENIARFGDYNIGIYIGKNFLFDFKNWSHFGLECSNEEYNQRKLMVKQWVPDWLKSEKPVDQHASSERVMNKEDKIDKSKDSFLSVVNREFYKSKGQCDVARAVLSVPPGETLVAILATGEGKSLIFQLVHMIGFLGDSDFSRSGLTVVIVPTVALAINHEQEAKKLCSMNHPLAYQGGSDESNLQIMERIRDGSQGICFASPEAVCGPLRSVILEAAKLEKLKAIVIDEAHIIDQWGTDFRTSFQELSFFIQQLKSLAGFDRKLRTIMLSATLSEASLETLNVLFSIEKEIPIVASVRLRKEPEYWVSSETSDEKRKSRVLEAIYHVPRPAILYATTKEDVGYWYRYLKLYGFNNLEMMDGDTLTAERERIVSKWKSGKLDLVVATSAFGLGIDYQNARSVIHACIPETLDRFYQEVGRGGRDGKSSLSLIIPSYSDIDIARNLNAKKVITLERGLVRWTAMFKKKELVGNKIYIRLDVAPGTSEKDIDMVGPSNTGWNMRTLLLMARSKVLKILGHPLKKIKEIGQWVEISEPHEDHLSAEFWKKIIGPIRTKISNETQKQLDLMRDYLREEKCVSELLESLYEINKSYLNCGLCGFCRKNKQHNIPMKSSVSFKLNMQPKINEFINKSLLDSRRKLYITYKNSEFKPRENRRFRDCLIKLQKLGLGKMLLIGEDFPFDEKYLEFAKKTVFFIERVANTGSSLINFPPGVEMAFYGFNQIINKLDIEYDQLEANPRIFVFPEDQQYDGRSLVDVVDGRLWSISDLINKVEL